MHIENSVGRIPNQVIHNRANSSAKGPAHMENTEKILTVNIVGGLFFRLVCNCPRLSKKVPAHRHKTQTKKKEENIVCQPLNQLVCNRANSSGKGPAHLDNIKTKDKQLTV